MTEQEYKTKLEALYADLNTKRNILYVDYAHSNNPYNVGDIIIDHIGSGQIESWRMYIESRRDLPMLVYRCKNLLKNGNQSKKEPVRDIYQSNII